MKRNTFFYFLIISSVYLSAQNERELKEQHKLLKANQMSVVSETVVTKYANLESEIVNNLIKKQIPQGFPEFNPKQETVDQYKLKVNDWYFQNKDLLNPEFKKKLIGNTQQN